jgi:hypothetical protein
MPTASIPLPRVDIVRPGVQDDPSASRVVGRGVTGPFIDHGCSGPLHLRGRRQGHEDEGQAGQRLGKVVPGCLTHAGLPCCGGPELLPR